MFESLPAGSNNNLADKLYQAGCRFFFVDSLWFRSGDDLFNTNINDQPNSVERIENSENACHHWL